MLTQFKLKSRLLAAVLPLLFGSALLENVTAAPLDTANQEMQSAKDRALETVKKQYQPDLDALDKEIKAAQQELDSFYIRDPQAKTDADKVPVREVPFTPKPINETDLRDSLQKEFRNIIDAQGKPLKEAIESAKTTKDTQAAKGTFDAFFTSANKSSEGMLETFVSALKTWIEESLRNKERDFAQQKAKIVSIANYFISPQKINEKAPDFAGVIREALKSAGSKSLATLGSGEPSQTSPSSIPSGSPSPSPSVPASGAPIAPLPAAPLSGGAAPSPSASPTPAPPPALPPQSAVPIPEVAAPTSDNKKELEERLEKLEHSLKGAERSGQDDSLLSKRLDSLQSRLEDYDNILALRARAAQEAEQKASAIQSRHQIWLAALSVAALLAAATGAAALFKKGGAPQRSAASVMADQTARAGIQDLSNRLEALESSANKTHAEAQATPPAALATCEELAALSQRIDLQMNEFRSRLVADGEEVGRLRGLLVLDSGGRDRVIHGLYEAVASAKSVTEPSLASVERLLARLQLDSFRKITRDRVEPQLLQDACAHIRATLDDAQRHADSLPAQLYVWEEARLQQVIDSVKGVERDAAKAVTLRTVLVRLLLSTYRSAGLREPMDKALDLAEDLKLLAPSGGPLRWTMECDGQGISADPADDRALWHLRGAKRAGNRTVLFPLVTENGAKLFAGVVTYEV